MPQVFPRAIQLEVLDFITGQELVLKLYKNDVTPSDTSQASDFTEADFTGYAEVELDAEKWTNTAGAPSVALYSEDVQFTSTAGSQDQSIYGYFIVKKSNGALVSAERFRPSPQTPPKINNDGDAVKVRPRMTTGNAS